MNQSTNSKPASENLLKRARRLADDLLFPNANEVDRSGELPVAQLDRIAEEGLYGLAGPAELGGVGADPATATAIIETLAGGCLTTCFVWMQHQNAAGLAARAEGPFHDRWAESLAKAAIKAGVAFAHLLRPEVVISARLVDPEDPSQGWLLNGTAPWVTGWGYIDIISTAARTNVTRDDGNGTILDSGDVLWLFVDAIPSATLRARKLDLSAVNSSATYAVEFVDHHVPADRVALVERYKDWRANYAKGLRVNASLGLGLCERAIRLLDETAADHTYRRALDAVRLRLDSASVDGASINEMPQARAELSTLAVRITAALVAAVGGRSVMLDHAGQRLAREALFLLIQGQTAEIRRHQLTGLAMEPVFATLEADDRHG